MARVRVGSTIVFQTAERCAWCTRPVKNILICAKCAKRNKARENAWLNQQYSRVQVLSETAAEIARAHFSKTELRDDFTFLVTGPEQLALGVWRASWQRAWPVQTRSGRWVELREHFDTWVPFTLMPDRASAIKYYARVWGGVRKLIKAAAPAQQRTRKRKETQP